jgi:prephenate dehydrogenase
MTSSEKDTIPFADSRKIAVIGTGHMGSWFAREFAHDGHDVVVFDRDSESLQQLSGLNTLTTLSELQDIQPDMLLNAVSILQTITAFDACIPYLPEACVLVDVASVKGELPEFYQKTPFRYASIHPMFGPTFANVNQLAEENAILINESDQETYAFFEQFFHQRKLNLFDFSFREHDEMIAYSLTIPFASTLVFAACMKNTAVPGTTFKRHLTIARGLLSEDDHLLAEILFNAYSAEQLEHITARLEFLKHIIKGRDYEEAQRFFNTLRRNITPHHQ